MNEKLSEKQITVPAYRQLYKKFADSLPTAWLYTMYSKELERYWNVGGDFNKEEFAAEDKCKGISELQDCLVIEKCNAVVDDKDDDEKPERRTKRSELCKKCFWFGVLLSILD